MKPHDSSRAGGPNQGEGDRISARHYNRNVREFVVDGKVDDAAREARLFVETNPDDAARAEARARRGPRGPRVTLDELVAKGRTVVDRVRPYVQRAATRIRSRFGRT